MRKTRPYGELPSKEEFSYAFDAECDSGLFQFRNDPHVGNCEMSCAKLWAEVEKATLEYTSASESGSASDSGEADKNYINAAAAEWVASVLYVLGFEWV